MTQIEIAKILKPQGIKGEVKALALTNLLAVFKNLKNCFINGEMFDISYINIRQGFLYIKLKNINTRNQAEELRNKIIFIEKSLLEGQKKDDEFFVEDLIGMLLYNEEGNYVGQILDVVNYGASDVFVIEKDGREMQVPYIDEVFIAKNGSLIVNQHKFDEVCV